MEKYPIEAIAFLLADMTYHFNAGIFKLFQSLSGYKGIGIIGANTDPCDTGSNDCLGAGRIFPIMAARFKCNVHSCSCRFLRAVSQGIPFRMKFTVSFMPALTDDSAVPDNHSTYQRIRVDKPDATSGKCDRSLHILFIRHNFLQPITPAMSVPVSECTPCASIFLILRKKHPKTQFRGVLLVSFFSHPDFTVGSGIAPDQPVQGIQAHGLRHAVPLPSAMNFTYPEELYRSPPCRLNSHTLGNTGQIPPDGFAFVLLAYNVALKSMPSGCTENPVI
jgi:hypothetical protein